ncbi:hypothetical protein GPECTOR_9g457 [Gonium pectorale]|uniref:DNA-directed DNA polymerase n=1 Tax=Gonium pectorale TaxID=33097 RepID=A0A150GRK3_GONPE|nr:hypothetical protein GPECTOR_9g457 [Gonium pectorale]|eukprot:KXZ52413.1 hypothetical protein GPECTOR_9g457 [Gonium pectorale]
MAEAHRRQSRRSSLQTGGSQVGAGNLASSLAAAAAAGDSGAAAGDGSGDACAAGDAGGDGVEAAVPEPPRQLEAYLPEPLCQAYYERGGRFELYEWQAECLCQLGVLMGRNLVYCAPTSGGKSMVAEVLGIRRLLTTGKPFMLVLPFVALCAEKADALQALLAPINRTVNSAYGGQHSGKIIQPGVGAIVATIEKANTLINAMLEEETLGELSAVIIDELHMVGEEERGYLLELLLTKLRFATSAAAGGGGEVEEEKFDWTAVGPAYQRDGLQVIGMSATMPNVDVVARWLDAALYTTSFRPVHLQEYVKVGRRVLDASGQLVRELQVEPGWEERDSDHVALLTRETVRDGHSVLIFCASKLWCEKVAEHIARLILVNQRDAPPVPPAIGAGPGVAAGADAASPSRNARDAFVAELRRLSGTDPTLPELVARGVAYHHAGLSNEERDLVEAAYKAGAISVLTATSTLAAGVNLPARRVIFRHSYIGKQDNPIDATKYRQMSGRAGRAGIDSAGESYLICEKNKPVANLLALMQQKANPIASCLTETKKGMKRAVLEVVASGAVSSGADVKRFIGCTLLHAQFGFQAVAKATIAALHWLKDNGFIRVDEVTLNWGPTPFGKATLASSMPPEEALVVRADLERARQSLVLATDLHVTYLVTPIKEDLRVDWEIYFHWFEKLSKVDARVAELVGVVPGYLVKLRQGHRGARGAGGGAASADAEKERIARRFFAAMVLNDLIQEVPLKEVAEKYGLGKEKGPLEGLQERAGRFAAMVAAFCERLGWADLEVIIAKFQSRVWYGVRPEVVALTEIPYVKGHRARVLFKAGLRTPEAVAGCELDRLVEILSTGAGAPRNPEQEEQQRRTERRAARMILQGAKDLVNQKLHGGQRHPEHAGAAAAAPKRPGGALQADDDSHEAKRPRPGFTVLKTVAEVAAACEQLKQVGIWGFALDFADSTSAPVAANPGFQLPSVPQVALGRGVLTNSIGLPSHYDLEPAMAEEAGHAAAAAAAPSPGGAALLGRAEGIAISAFDGCALYVPLIPADGDAGAAAACATAREAAAVWQEILQLLAHSGSTKVTFELKQQLLRAAAVDGSAAGGVPLPSAPSPPGGGAGPVAAGAFSAALATSAAAAAAAGGAVTAAAEVASPAKAHLAVARGSLPLDVADPVVDVRILLWMLNPDDSVNLPRGKSGKLTATKGLEERMKMPEVCGSSAHIKALGVLNCAGTLARQLPTRQADACRRAAMVRRIYQDKLPRLQSEGLLRPLLEVEMPLVRVLAGMEATGVALAPAVLRSQRGPLEARLRQLAHKAHVAAGMTFDLNSPKDVSEVLFQHLNLPAPPCAFTSQHQKHPSTKKEVLEELEESTRHPILRPLLDYRSLHKLLTGFVETLYSTAKGQWLRQAAAQQAAEGREAAGRSGPVPDVIRLCGTWLHTATATGRLAMDEPNLQTIPRPVEYTFAMSQESAELLPLEPGGAGGCDGVAQGGGAPRIVTLHFNLRTAFVAPPGHVVLAADYKQIELRLMAHFSGDAALCALLRNPNHDPFTLLAAEWKRLPAEQITSELRVQAKRLAYGMLYGMGTSTLAAELSVSVTEAAELSDNFRRAIPGVDRWTKEIVEECRSCGYVGTLLGRRRYFPRINERSCKDARNYRAQAERQAVNTVCQGSAADLVKAAMVTLARRLGEAGLAGRARMVLMVHDELVFEVESGLLPAVAALVRQVLEGQVALSVPLPVKLSAGPSWGELTEYDPPPQP